MAVTNSVGGAQLECMQGKNGHMGYGAGLAGQVRLKDNHWWRGVR